MPVYKMKGSKNGKQKYRVRVNYTDIYGNAKQLDRVAYGSAEAKELERTLEHEVKAKKNTPVKRLTIDELYKQYKQSKQGEVRYSTLDKDERIFNAHISPYIGSISLDKISVPILAEWKNTINKKPSSKNKDKLLEVTTKQNTFASLRALLNYAVKMDYIMQNPLTKVGNFKDANTLTKEMLYYTSDEFKLFINAAHDYAENSPYYIDWDYYVFFNIAFYMGLRKGEIHALKWSDIKDGYMSITRSINQKSKSRDIETPPKNKSSIRTIQIPKPLMEILTEHKERYKQITEDFNDDFRICGGKKSLRDTSIQNKNVRFASNAGVKKIRIHDFRHSHASVLANSGINIMEVARRLGHADVEETWNRYSHLYPREEERATQIFNKIV